MLHSSMPVGITHIEAFVDNGRRYADKKRTQDSRLYYLQMWRPSKQSHNAKAEGRQGKKRLLT